MNKIYTGYDLITRYDNVIEDNECDIIYNYVYNIKKDNKPLDIKQMPWHEKDTLSYNKISDITIKQYIDTIKYKIKKIIDDNYNTEVFPHFSDLVFWRTGRTMWWHKDNGYEDTDPILKVREYSVVCYINDQYSGGETLIKQGSSIYTSVPKKGSVVIFTSDERCEHRVSEIKDGNRLTLAIWYTTDSKYEEK
jgi:hypothetical protein